MTQQAKNSLELYRGGDPHVIKQLLSRQAKHIVEELEKHFNVTSQDELAVRLSMGK